jgi:hypothetical protein
MTVRLWRSQLVMERIAEGVFEFPDGDAIFRMDLDRYAEMGCPESITLTIEPGALIDGTDAL